MSAKWIVYLITTPFVIYSMDAIQINQIFKKNKVMQARLFYFFLAVGLIYLVANFVYDLFLSSKFF